MNSSREFVEEMLNKIDVRINGDRPHDVQVNDEAVFDRVVRGGRLAIGESYMDGQWDCEELEEVIYRSIQADLDEEINLSWRGWGYFLKAKLFNLQSQERAAEVGEKHYDIGNDLYEEMLDERMIYSCGYWKQAENLEKAQRDKLDLICRKLELEPGQRLLDIGCGWGGLVEYASKNYGVEAVGITVSEEQVKYGNRLCADLPVEVRFQDYRDLEEKFDRIVSVGMFEHVGVKNYREFMEVAERCLTANGLFLLHTIGTNVSTEATDPWIHKYIFPNGMLPSPPQISEAAEGLFVLEDWHNFGPDYAKTLNAWRDNFEAAWPQLKENYTQKFYRMWKYYLSISAASFRARRNQLWQIVFSPRNTPRRDYQSVR